MGDRPILFNDAMIRAILSGSKTQTRRPVKPQPTPYEPSTCRHAPKHPAAYLDSYCSEQKTTENPRGMSDLWCWWTPDDRQAPGEFRCPFGAPGYTLWVRECWGAWHCANIESDEWEPVRRPLLGSWDDEREQNGDPKIEYRATSKSVGPWLPSIHMPRWASRISLRVTSVRVERLRDITEQDAQAEGMPPSPGVGSCWETFVHAWPYDGTDYEWMANPWVWVVEFKRIGGAK